MRIIIDGNTLENRKAGIGHYTYNLIHELADVLGESDKLFVGIRQKLLDKNVELGIKRVPVIKTTERSFSKYMPFSPHWMRGFDIYHQPNYVPHAFHGKVVTTIHDMSHRVYPHYHPRRRVLLLRAFENRLRKADRIITDSQHARGEIVELLRIPEDRVRVIYLGASLEYRPLYMSQVKRKELQIKYNLPERFLLYVGTIEPRKNLERLIEAYYLYKGEEPNSELKLVLAGGKGWLYEGILTRVQELHLEKDIVFTGYVDGEDLPFLYNMAVAFIYPSLYEGFGLPPLEAMSCGTPVISSNTSSIPEVVGEAGILVDPYQVNDLAAAIYKVAGSVSLQNELSQKGLERAQLFSWKKCAEETLQVYRECMQE
jgi:glycosyltransferase involved in cell wall biosynthesis